MICLIITTLCVISILTGIIIYIYNPIAGFYFIVGARIAAEYTTTTNCNQTIILGSYAIVIIIITIFSILHNKNFQLNIAPINTYYLFIFISLLSSALTDDLFSSLSMLLKITCLLAFFLMSYNLIDSKEKITESLKYFTYSSIIPIIYGIYQLYSGTGLHVSSFWGYSGTHILSFFSHPNQFAFYLAINVFALIILIQNTTKNKLKLYLHLGIILVLIVFTFSRSVWVLLLACIIISSFFYKKLRFPVIIASILFTLFLSSAIVGGLTEFIYKEKEQVTSVDFRLDMATQLLNNAFPERPILGFGPGTSLSVVNKYTSFSYLPPHNDYIRILIETGSLGLISFLLFLIVNFSLIIINIRQFRNNNYIAIILILMFFLTTIMISTNHIGFISTSGMWFLLFGIAHKGYKLYKQT